MTFKEKIETTDAPKAIGPYSQAISVALPEKGLLFISGQLPIDPSTGNLIQSIREATQQVLKNIEAILKAGKSDLSHVVKVEIFLKDLQHFQEVNEEYGKFFSQPPFPARQTVQVARLPMDALIEISCIALIKV